ncbi:MAG TPA: carbon-nitrogen hydrolase family protein [Anaerolineae bacterium]|nr:carbon-nitrogen hydrolase family protein [Anaerolineae bacterium]
MADYPEFTLAAVQAAPVYFDREASTEKACQLITEAGHKGADLAAFGETWLPGYPFFHSSVLANQGRVTYLSNAVVIPSPTTDRLCMAAQKAGVDVAIGVAELDPRTRGTVYCTLLFISREGEILGRHRKLKPSGAERTVWGEGDGVGLRVYERPYGRISGLNCWEHRMLLPGYALMALGTQIHVATWPFSWHLDPDLNSAPFVSQVFAAQGGCYVIATSALLRPEDVQEAYRALATSEVDEWIGAKKGGCRIIAPSGTVIAQAAVGEETILTAPVSLEAVLQAKASIDVGGHYSRPDVLQLHVNRRPLERVVVSDVSVTPDDSQSSGSHEYQERTKDAEVQ